jgi:two-component system NarL family sensor kinase
MLWPARESLRPKSLEGWSRRGSGQRVLRTPRRALRLPGPVAQFALSVVIALLFVGLGSAYVFRRFGTNEAIREARSITATVAHGVIEPVLRDSIVTGDPGAIAALDRVVRRHVILNDIVRVKLWTADGRIVYSDEKRLIGAVYPLKQDDRRVLRSDATDASISNLSAPENRFERSYGKLLEVYLPVETPRGRRLLFETYQRYSSVQSGGYRLWIEFLPILLGALAVLAAVQLPLAWSLARRLRAGQQERERLLLRSIQASNLERRRIASDLHDTVVQDLAGLSLSLTAAAERSEAAAPEQTRAALRRTATSMRHAIRRLRSLLVEIYPPSLQAEGLAPALSDLLAPLADEGVETRLDIPDGIELGSATEQLLFRCAQEAIRNAAEHAHAHRVSVRVGQDSDRSRVTLVVEDDGRGFGQDELARRREEGHLGITLLEGAALDLGGTLRVESEPGTGTRVVLEVPA